MPSIVLIERAGGGVSIMRPVGDADVAAAVAKWEAAQGVAAISWRQGEIALPAGRVFRDAWRWDGAGVTIDMPAAREIHAARLGGAIAAETVALDRRESIARFAGRGADADAALAAKAALASLDRSPLAAQIAAASTPADLLAVWPPELDARRPA